MAANSNNDDNSETCARCGQPHRRCVAHNRSGDPCKFWPADGLTVCKFHGGRAPQVLAAALRRRAEAAAIEAVATYGLPRDVEPHDALLEEIARTAGHVDYLAAKVADLDPAVLVHGVTLVRETTGPGGERERQRTEAAAVNVWLELYLRERRHLVEVSRTAIAAGVEERRVTLAERTGGLIAQVIRGVLADLGVADRPEVPQIVRRHLLSLPVAG